MSFGQTGQPSPLPSLRRELVDQEMKQLLSHVLGTTHWFTVFVGLAFLVTLGWFADGFYSVVEGLARWLVLSQPPGWELRIHLAPPLFFLLLLLWILGRARRWRERLRFRVVAERPPRPAKVLVLFLSAFPPHQRDAILAAYEGVQGALSDFEVRQQVEKAWRMPIEALASHQETLSQLVVVTSPGEDGSHRLLSRFFGLLGRLWPGHGLMLRTVEEFVPEFDKGIDFFDLERQVQVVDSIVRQLVEEGSNPEDIVIDVTGGTKLSTVAGQSVALAEGRRFQYVFTDGYEVVAYEASYLEVEGGGQVRGSITRD